MSQVAMVLFIVTDVISVLSVVVVPSPKDASLTLDASGSNT
jgi:hypothetical protein